MHFVESGYRFEFDKSWKVSKFDSHRYYRWLSGQGLKGIDFIAIQPNKQLMFIEVKNYRMELPDSMELASLFYKKIQDSIRIIRVLQQYFNRRLLYRTLEKTIKRWPHLFGEWGYWTEVGDLLDFPENCHFVLWLNSNEGISAAYQESVIVNLREEFGPEFKFHLLPYEKLTFDLGFKGEKVT